MTAIPSTVKLLAGLCETDFVCSVAQAIILQAKTVPDPRYLGTLRVAIEREVDRLRRRSKTNWRLNGPESVPAEYGESVLHVPEQDMDLFEVGDKLMIPLGYESKEKPEVIQILEVDQIQNTVRIARNVNLDGAHPIPKGCYMYCITLGVPPWNVSFRGGTISRP